MFVTATCPFATRHAHATATASLFATRPHRGVCLCLSLFALNPLPPSFHPSFFPKHLPPPLPCHPTSPRMLPSRQSRPMRTTSTNTRWKLRRPVSDLGRSCAVLLRSHGESSCRSICSLPGPRLGQLYHRSATIRSECGNLADSLNLQTTPPSPKSKSPTPAPHPPPLLLLPPPHPALNPTITSSRKVTMSTRTTTIMPIRRARRARRSTVDWSVGLRPKSRGPGR
jgi:hypothetical protein